MLEPTNTLEFLEVSTQKKHWNENSTKYSENDYKLANFSIYVAVSKANHPQISY